MYFMNFILFWGQFDYRQYESSFRKIFTEDKGEDGHEFYEDVETGTGRVFEWVADCVADDCGLVDL